MLTLRNGDTLKLTATFQHMGAAFTGAVVYAALGKRQPLGGFNEHLAGHAVVTNIIDDATWIIYGVDVFIPIINIGTSHPGGSDYEVYAKLMYIPGPDIFWFGLENDITLEAPVIPAAFRELDCSYIKV